MKKGMNALIAVTGILLSLQSLADTHIPAGNVSGIWNQSGSPYIIDGTISIADVDQLVIDPGVRVIFSGHYKLNVFGRIEAVGNSSDSIVFTAQNPANGWWGLRFNNTDVNGQQASKLAFCHFEYGRADGGTSVDRYGGAVYCSQSSQLLIDRCTFRNNFALRCGGAIACDNSDITLSGSSIVQNEAGESGGGLYCLFSDPQITHVTFYDNYAAAYGGAVYGSSYAPAAHPCLTNCILWSNYPDEIEILTANITVIYSDVMGGWPGAGNIMNDPLFINPAINNLSLQPCSPCVDAGDPSSPVDPDGTVTDMGAFYFNQLAGTVVPGGDVSGTWSSSASPYLVCGDISIPAAGSLTVESGTEVIFMGHYRFSVYGRLSAQGTAADSIMFTANDPVSGWHGFRFINTNNNGQDSTRMEYCGIEYGNATGTGSDNQGGKFYMENSSKVLIQNSMISKNLATGGGGFYLNQSSPKVQNCHIFYNTPDGFCVANSSAPAISGCVIEWNSGMGINLTGASVMPVVENCMVNHNNNFPVRAYAHQVGGFSGNSYTGNLYQIFYVWGSAVNLDGVWDNPGIPYYISGTVIIQGTDGPDGVTVLDLTPGTVMKMGNTIGIQVGHPSNSAFPGGLMALGNLNDSIVFTASTDNPSPGYWGGITFENYASDMHCQMDYCVIEYGGYSSFENIYCNQASPVLSHCTSRSGSGNGIYLISGNPVIDHCNVSSNTVSGIYCSQSSPQIYHSDIGYNMSYGLFFTNASANPVIDHCIVTGNSNCGIYSSSTNFLTVSGSIIENNASYGLYCNSFVDQLVITGNQINGNNNYPVYIYANQAGGLSGNTYSGNLYQKIYIAGATISMDAVWENPGIPYYISGNVNIQGTDGSNGITTLTLSPGCELKFGSTVFLYTGHNSNQSYPGGLIAAGTELQPILFTSNQTSPSAGYWSGLYFANYAADSLCTLENCIVEYGGYSTYSNITCYHSAPSLKHCNIRYSGSDGISYDNSPFPLIEFCIITHNSSAGISCNTSYQPVITNNTICSNASSGIRVFSGCNPAIVNNILYDNYNPITALTQLSNIYHNDCWLNDTIIADNLPAGFGSLVTFNVHGKPCDPFYNIFLDPMFEDPANNNYHITIYSSCINAGDPNLPYDPDNTISDIGVYYYTLLGDPSITNITDIPNDQGKQVGITWQKSPLDALGSPAPVSFYSLWRYDDFAEGKAYRLIHDPAALMDILTDSEGESMDEIIMWENGDLFLTYITQVPGIGFNEYTAMAPTLFDSCETSVNYTTFVVLAHMYAPQLYYSSQADSGYSVDNLAPHVPENFSGVFAGGQVKLNWSPVPDQDFQYYALYKSEDPLVFPQDPFAVTMDTIYYDGNILADTVYYMATAFDFNGNGSAPSQVAEVITSSGLALDIKVFLQGPFTGTLMNPGLNAGGYIPLSQPYSQAPWSYTGSEAVASIPNADIIDWMLIELRDAPDAASAGSAAVVTQQAAFLLKDGSIVSTDGSTLPLFNYSPVNFLFAVLWHRNHLGILSAMPLTGNGGVYSYDFTIGSGQVFGGINAHKEIAPGIWGMIAADGNADDQVNNGDKNDVWTPQAGTSGYLPGDFNMNGEVNNSDKNDLWKPNTGLGGQVPE
ncbi:MAG: right-handed parallel beta-helix repeat-containing protein [Bacteroidales bacterium]|nr:right-handed parallel beta-helix repeat-containing protein [Bacteroidales bacterium]